APTPPTRRVSPHSTGRRPSTCSTASHMHLYTPRRNQMLTPLIVSSATSLKKPSTNMIVACMCRFLSCHSRRQSASSYQGELLKAIPAVSTEVDSLEYPEIEVIDTCSTCLDLTPDGSRQRHVP